MGGNSGPARKMVRICFNYMQLALNLHCEKSWVFSEQEESTSSKIESSTLHKLFL